MRTFAFKKWYLFSLCMSLFPVTCLPASSPCAPLDNEGIRQMTTRVVIPELCFTRSKVCDIENSLENLSGSNLENISSFFDNIFSVSEKLEIVVSSIDIIFESVIDNLTALEELFEGVGSKVCLVEDTVNEMLDKVCDIELTVNENLDKTCEVRSSVNEVLDDTRDIGATVNTTLSKVCDIELTVNENLDKTCEVRSSVNEGLDDIREIDSQLDVVESKIDAISGGCDLVDITATVNETLSKVCDIELTVNENLDTTLDVDSRVEVIESKVDFSTSKVCQILDDLTANTVIKLSQFCLSDTQVASFGQLTGLLIMIL